MHFESIRASAEDNLLHGHFYDWHGCHADKCVKFNGIILNIIKVVLPDLSRSIFQVYVHSLVDIHFCLSRLHIFAYLLISLRFHKWLDLFAKFYSIIIEFLPIERTGSFSDVAT